MNGHLTRFCDARDITFTRSRPYQRNDNRMWKRRTTPSSARSWERTGSHVTKVYDNAQTPCARMLARKDVAEETKKRLLATRTELDMTTLLHEIVLCQDQLDEIARRTQPLVIKKRGSYATISGEFTT